MTVTLAATIDDTTHALSLSDPVDVEPGDLRLLEDEIVQVIGYRTQRNPRLLDKSKVQVIRGVQQTARAAHTSGTELLGVADAFVAGDDEAEPSPFPESGGTFSGDASDVPLADPVAGQTDVQAALEALESTGDGVTVVRLAIAFDTPNLTIKNFPIIALDIGAQTFTINGDHTALFPAGAVLDVIGSSENNRTYAVDTATLVDGDTVIAVDDSSVFDDDTVDGNVANTGTAGILLYAPAVGDAFLTDPRGSLVVGWDGTGTPSIAFQSYGGLNGQMMNVSIGTGYEDNFLDAHWREPLTTVLNNWYIFSDTTPVYAYVHDGNYGDPGASQGSGFVLVLVSRA